MRLSISALEDLELISVPCRSKSQSKERKLLWMLTRVVLGPLQVKLANGRLSYVSMEPINYKYVSTVSAVST